MPQYDNDNYKLIGCFVQIMLGVICIAAIAACIRSTKTKATNWLRDNVRQIVREELDR